MTRWRRFLLWTGWARPRATDIPTAVRLDPPPFPWALLFHSLQAQLVNAGLRISKVAFSDISFYVCDELPADIVNLVRPVNGLVYDERTVFGGLWMASDKSIVIVRQYLNDHTIIRHEMTHALGAPDHGDVWFNETFDNDTGPQPEEL